MSLVRSFSSSLNICLTIFETFTHVLDLDPSTMSSNCLEHCLFMIVCSFAWVCILRSSWGSTYMPTFLCGLTVLSPKSKKTHHVKFFLIGWLFPVSWIFSGQYIWFYFQQRGCSYRSLVLETAALYNISCVFLLHHTIYLIWSHRIDQCSQKRKYSTIFLHYLCHTKLTERFLVAQKRVTVSFTVTFLLCLFLHSALHSFGAWSPCFQGVCTERSAFALKQKGTGKSREYRHKVMNTCTWSYMMAGTYGSLGSESRTHVKRVAGSSPGAGSTTMTLGAISPLLALQRICDHDAELTARMWCIQSYSKNFSPDKVWERRQFWKLLRGVANNDLAINDLGLPEYNKVPAGYHTSWSRWVCGLIANHCWGTQLL